ncbi:MAG: long-chain fatty acid--CoA ligase [Caldilineaceae bacterium]|nr:long-chain fatty acid--CoA ligase [Caldilineaceae bacterium]
MFVGDWLARRAQLTPDKVAVVDTVAGRDVTYAAWNAQANRSAHWLRALGVERGDRVAVLAMNSMVYLEIWFACAKLGAVLQNLNWRLNKAELAAIVADAAPRALLYGREFAATAAALRATAPSLRHMVSIGDGASGAGSCLAEREAFPATAPVAAPVHADEPWVICYTGGSTGLPKGAILTHGNVLANIANTVAGWGVRADDVAVLNAPLFHTGGLNVFTAPLAYVGGTSILCRHFDADQIFDLLAERRFTLLFGVPTMYVMLQRHPRWARADFSPCRIVISGGAPCPPPVYERFWAKGVPFKSGYGLTEAGPNNFWLPDTDVQRKPGAVGLPLPHVEIRIVDEQGQPCAPGEVGELWIRGPHVTPGYWNNPAATEAVLVDGWLHTGDLAHGDREGYVTIVGRRKEMFISGGENIYPAEVENALYSHPAVAEAAVIAVADAVWGEVGRAVVALHAGADLSEQQLLAFLGERIGRYKQPRSIVFVEALPRTGTGKIDKLRLALLYGTAESAT